MRRDDHLLVTREALELSSCHALAAEPACGASASFVGTVRSPNEGAEVAYIDYEGYEPMIVGQMKVIARELRQRFDLGSLVIAHRLGRLGPGEASIIIVIAARHRRDALEACRHAIDRAKDLLPVWKYEATAQGGSWLPGSSKAGEPL